METINRKGVSQNREIENGNFGMSVSIAPLTPRDPRLRPGEARRDRPYSKPFTAVRVALATVLTKAPPGSATMMTAKPEVMSG
jgi:hypothetical protein